MKYRTLNIIKKAALCLVGAMVLTSCEKEDSLKESIFDLEEKEKTELDQWIHDNYVIPYNIAATYKWNQAFGYFDKTLTPPKVENVKPALQMVKKLWIDTYSELGGPEFVKEIAPRQFHLIGSYNINGDGTITLGEAGGGARITLFNTDYVDPSDLESIRMFVHTVQHEYVHILNQTKPYNKVAWREIGNGGYTSTWYNESDAGSNNLGFVTPYARKSFDEDFAETASFVLMKTKAEYEAFLNGIQNPEGRKIIEQKVQAVSDYYATKLKIDFMALRDVAEIHTQEVLNGNLD